MEDYNLDIGSIVKSRREQLGLTQDQVAEHTGISKPYLSNIETGKIKNPPTDSVLEAIEQTLQFEPGDLIRIAHLERTPTDIRQEFESLQASISKFRGIMKALIKADAVSPTGEVDISALAGQLDSEHNAGSYAPGQLVPVINKMTAGYPQDFTDLDYPPGVADEYVRCPGVTDPQAFAARIHGDSMEPKYHQDDIVVFSPNTPAQPGNDCFVRLTPGEGTTFKRFYQDDDQTIRLQPLNNAYPAKTYNLKEITGLWPAIYRIEKLI